MEICQTCQMMPCICASTIDVDTEKPVAPRPGPENCEDVIMPFGKHKGKPLGQILIDDGAYLDWLNSGDVKLFGHMATAVAEMNQKYASEIEQAIEARRTAFFRTKGKKL